VTVFFNGQFLEKQAVCISTDDRGFLFADGAYEVVRWSAGHFFRPSDHLRRLERSLAEIRISAPDMAILEDVSRQLVERNGLSAGDATVYVQVTRGAAPRKHAFPPPDTPATVYACARPFTALTEAMEKGVRVICVEDVRWSRCDIKSIALLPNVLANQQAGEAGAHEALFVRDGIVTEGSHTNFCAVFDGRLVTHPVSNRILAGITRAAVLEFCRGLGIPVEETPIARDALADASEMMLVGTTTDVVPVVQVDRRTVGNGTPGPVSRQLQAALRDAMCG